MARKKWKKGPPYRLRESQQVQEAIKSEDGTDYGPDAYLVVPDKDAPSGWKLRIKELVDGKKEVTRAQLGRALAALFEGFRGQKVELTADQRKAAIGRLRAEYRKLGVEGDDLPKELQEAGLPAELVGAFLGADDARFDEALSLRDHDEQVCRAFHEKFNPSVVGGQPVEYFPVEVYEDCAVAKKGGKTFRVPYAFKDGQVVFGSDDLQEVQVEYKPVSEPKPVAESLTVTERYQEAEAAGSLQEATDEQGWIWDVTVIKAGRTKERSLPNGKRYVRDYPADVLQKATGLFEGVHVFAFSGQEHAPDPGAKGVRDAVGFLENCRMEGQEMRAHLHLFKDSEWLRARLMGLKEAKRLDKAGLSIDAGGNGAWSMDGDLAVFKVSEITEAASVEIVYSPAAGGHVQRLVASTTGDHEMNPKDILKLIESLRPDLAKGVDADKVTAEQVNALLQEAMKPKADPPKADAPKVEVSTGQTITVQQMTETVNALQKLQEQVNIQACQALLAAKLAESKLPERVQQKIRKQYPGVVTEAQLAEAITTEKEVLAAILGSMPQSFVQVTVTQEERDKKIRALEAMFWGGPNDRSHPNFPAHLKDVKPYRSLHQAYREITGIQQPTDREIFAETAMSHPAFDKADNPRLVAMWRAFRESIKTSDWGDILGDEITRRMQAEFNIPYLQEWRKIVSDVTSIRDFRTNRRIKMGGYGVLSTVSEQGTYPSLTSPTDTEETYAVSKKGGLDDITFEAIKNDDIGAIRRLPVKLGRAAAQTLYRNVFDHIEDNTTLISDSVALVDASHSNSIGAVLSNTSLTTARQYMMDQASYGDTYETLGNANVPRWLLVPNELMETAWQLCAPWTVGQGEHDTASRNANFHSSYGLEPLNVPYFATATYYWVCADPSNGPTIEVGFLDGREEPELFVQDQPNVGSVFSADKITYKIRHIYGSFPLDYRWIAGYIG